MNQGIEMGGTAVCAKIDMEIYGEYLYISVREANEAVIAPNADEAHNNVYRFPIDGNPKTDFVNANTLFEITGASDSEKLVLDEISYERYYSEVIEDYRVSDVRVENTSEALLDIPDVLGMYYKERIDYMGQKVIFSYVEKDITPIFVTRMGRGRVLL